MTRPPAYHPGNFLMKNMNPTNSGLIYAYTVVACLSVLQGKMLDAKVKFEADLISDFSRTNKNKIYDYIKSLHKSSGLPPVLT